MTPTERIHQIARQSPEGPREYYTVQIGHVMAYLDEQARDRPQPPDEPKPEEPFKLDGWTCSTADNGWREAYLFPSVCARVDADGLSAWGSPCIPLAVVRWLLGDGTLPAR
jgi:hypothetical protein